MRRQPQQNTVTEMVQCRKCGGTHWRQYARKGNVRYMRCCDCGHHRIDRLIVRVTVRGMER